MAATFTFRRKSAATLIGLGLLVGILAGCNGPTTVDQAGRVGNYNIQFSMDPETLKPPQLVTLSYAVTDAATSKAVTKYDTIYGALIHNVIISRDLTVFQHRYSNQSLLDQFSMLTNFPQTGKYYSFTFFKPSGGDMQMLSGSIQSGDQGPAPQLRSDLDVSSNSYRTKDSYGSHFELFTAPGQIKAGQPTQLAVYATERGAPVRELWPFLNAPGYLWTIGEDGQNFGVEVGSSEGHVTGSTSSDPPSPRPTLAPDLDAALATRTAQPGPTLAPVQMTAQRSVLETPGAVTPSIGYGPTVAFTHTFPKAGLYKVWAEMQYRAQPVLIDWVIQVAP